MSQASMAGPSAQEGSGYVPDPDPPVAEATNISKRYGSTVALRDAHIRVLAGRTHALVGRNGAGKSTLVSIMTGLRAQDSGELRFNGEAAPALSNIAEWQRRVACVYQHSTIVPDLSVAENLFINQQPRRLGLIDWPQLRRQAAEVLDLWNIAVNVDMRAGDLGVEQRQLVEIARSLSRGARFVILDEPTAQLDGKEIRRLFQRLEELKSKGITFLFISHHLQEVYDICHDVTVLRDATHIITADVNDLPKEQLIAAMTGSAVHYPMANRQAQASGKVRKPVVNLNRLTGTTFADVSFDINEGEIIGLTGTTGSGRTEVAEAVAGLSAFSSGSAAVKGRPMVSGDVPVALKLNIGCVPKSRHREGLVLIQPISENVSMPIWDRLGPLGMIGPGRKEKLAADAMQTLDIHASGPDQIVGALSGGNQQKVVFGRALANDPTLLVLIDPTAGVDVKSKTALLEQAEKLRAAGKAILLSSSEVEDLRICDRVHVLVKGAIVATFEAGWTEAELVASIEGLDQ